MKIDGRIKNKLNIFFTENNFFYQITYFEIYINNLTNGIQLLFIRFSTLNFTR